MSTGTGMVDLVFNIMYNQLNKSQQKKFQGMLYSDLIDLLNSGSFTKDSVQLLCKKYDVIAAPALLYM